MEINPKFRSLIPPLAPEELAQLEANILRDGCRDPLVVWVPSEYEYEGALLKYSDKEVLQLADEYSGPIIGWEYESGGDFITEDDWPCTLIDGHNRYDICTRHGIEFKTVEMEFADEEAAMDWMDANQLGRRNLSPDAFKLALGRRYNRTKQNHGGQTPKGIDQIEPSLSTAAKLAAEHSVSEATVKRAGKFADEVAAKPELQRAIAERKPVLQAKREMKEERREERREENRAKVAEATTPEEIAEGGAKFATIVIDPPWDWGDEGDQDQLGRARPDYATMSKAQLLDLPLLELADDDCHIYLWITNRSMPKGFELLERWGFRYITALTWPKPSFGMGNYFRGQTEHVLFGVRGSQALKRKNASTLLPDWRRGPLGHSSKPVEFLEFVESCSPGPYLEMFSRSKRSGWVTWGESQ